MIYSSVKQKAAILANIQVGLMAAGAFIFGCLAAGRAEICWLPAIAIALAMFGREVIKDVADMEGDKKVGLKTIPLVYGISPTVNIACSAFMIAGLSATFFTWHYQHAPVASLILFADGVALAILLFFNRDQPLV